MRLDILRLVGDHMGTLQGRGIGFELRIEIKKRAIEILEASQEELTSGHAVGAIHQAEEEIMAERRSAEQKPE